MTTTSLMFASGILPALRQFVAETKLHPIMVNFTAALVPISVGSDVAARFLKNESLRNTAWWTLFYAAVITPFTAITCWLFWMADDSGVAGMTIHKWLGTALAMLLLGLFAWRHKLRRQHGWPTTFYFIAGAIFVAALVYQGYLGGVQVLNGM